MTDARLALYDLVADAATLYVGVTSSPRRREKGHRSMGRIPFERLVVIRWYDDQLAARRGEARRVRMMIPPYNTLHRRDDARPLSSNRKIWNRALAEGLLKAGCRTADVAAAVGVDRVTITTNFGRLVHKNFGRFGDPTPLSAAFKIIGTSADAVNAMLRASNLPELGSAITIERAFKELGQPLRRR